MSSTKITSTLTALLIAALVIPINLSSRFSAHAQDLEAQAVPGDLDTTFGNGGKVTAVFSSQPTNGHAMALQPDGKLVVAGDVSNATTDFLVTRFNANGSLDSSFGTGGMVTTDFFGGFDSAQSVTLQPDGRILVAGYARRGPTNDSADFALARYNTDGSLDAGFGIAGKATTDFFGQGDAGSALVLQPDGKAVLAGYSFQPTGPTTSVATMALARFVAAAPANFALGFEQSPATGERGTTVKAHVLITRSGDFSGNVTVTPPDALDIGIKVKPPFDIPTTDTSVTFKLKIKGGATPGSYPLTFTARDDAGHIAKATLTIVIQ